MKTKQTLLASALTLALCASANAEEGFVQHEAHVHGMVEFNIAQDGNQLLVEINAPGMDVVGFEHPPESESDHHIFDEKVALLKEATNILTVNDDAKCKVAHVDVENTSHHHDEGDEDEHHHEHGDEDHHEHHDDADEHHDEDEHHHDDGDEEHHDHEEHGGHSAFNIQYQFDCAEPSAINYIETKWFQQFPATHDIDVNIFTDMKQGAIELSPSQSRIALK